MPAEIYLPKPLTDVYAYLFPNIEFSRVHFYDGIPSLINSGQNGITIASTDFSGSIKVYLKEGTYNPCVFEIFLTIAHELVHVLQIQDSFTGGRIPGEWIFKYVTCWFGWFGFSSDCSNQFEKEAYDYSNGCPGTAGGQLRTCINSTPFINQSPCDCSTYPFYQMTTINGVTFLDNLEKSCSKLVKEHSNLSSKPCNYNPIAWLTGLIVAGLAIFGLSNLGGAIGSGIGVVAGGIIGWFLGGPLGGALGAYLGGIIGGLIGSLLGGLFGGSSNHIWFTVYDGNQWQIPDLPVSNGDHSKTDQGPALAVFNNRLYAAYKADGDDNLWYNYFDTGTRNWLTTDKEITSGSSTKTNDSPALAVYNNLLFMAYKSSGNSDLYYNYFDGSVWLTPDKIITRNGHTKTSHGPALAVFNNRLYMAYKSASDNALFYNYFDGSQWQDPDTEITNNGHIQTTDSPALAVYNNKLYMCYKSAADTKIFYTVFDGTSWTAPDIMITTNGQIQTSAGPALAVYNNLLYMAYKSASDDHIWYTTFNSITNTWMVPDVQITSGNYVKTARKPALAVFNNWLWMVYKDNS